MSPLLGGWGVLSVLVLPHPYMPFAHDPNLREPELIFMCFRLKWVSATLTGPPEDCVGAFAGLFFPTVEAYFTTGAAALAPDGRGRTRGPGVLDRDLECLCVGAGAVPRSAVVEVPSGNGAVALSRDGCTSGVGVED
eukprot:CAMPEP_0115266240 /NCGR_PEP_ID=MMETSP0270-20121206/51365_1 /TAXON_ID=71861 /ORGANISM="Scrippsiella trochoidea, Strain CCMP3099" /LENGTH=136 /DNA_ID=CAMNT_0002682329 /DNA_START=276 /DNA_END=686 /DNA_ORIENTATION=+